MITLCCPWVNKPYGIDYWIASFHRLKKPDSLKVIILDKSNNPDISKKLKELDAEYVQMSGHHGVYEHHDESNKHDKVERRRAICETIQQLNELREGHMVILEDDIIVGENDLVRLLECVDEDTWSVGATQYSREESQRCQIMVWKNCIINYASKRSRSKYKLFHERILDEKWDGVEEVTSTAGGFVFYHKDFLDQHNFYTDSGKTQDMEAGLRIASLGKKTKVHWGIKAIHMGPEDGLSFYKSYKCTTKLPNIK